MIIEPFSMFCTTQFLLSITFSIATLDFDSFICWSGTIKKGIKKAKIEIADVRYSFNILIVELTK